MRIATTWALPAHALTDAISFTSPPPIAPIMNRSKKIKPAHAIAAAPLFNPDQPNRISRATKAKNPALYVSQLGIRDVRMSNAPPIEATATAPIKKSFSDIVYFLKPRQGEVAVGWNVQQHRSRR